MSQLTLSGTCAEPTQSFGTPVSIPLMPQGPGCLMTTYTGQIEAELGDDTLRVLLGD
jgi:hypothetical protein